MLFIDKFFKPRIGGITLKKRAGIMFLCICLIMSVFLLCLAISVIGNESEGQQSVDDRFEIMATNPPVWTSYWDHISGEAEDVWNNPEFYVGATAEFNIQWVPEVIVTGAEMAANEEYEYEDFLYATTEDLTAEDGKSIKVVITDYFFGGYDEELEAHYDLWLKVEAAEGYELPQVLKENPYLLQSAILGDYPSLIPLPMKGMFTEEIISIQKNFDAAARTYDINAADVSYFFDVDYYYEEQFGLTFYDLGDLTYLDAISSSDYCYTAEKFVTLIPARVSIAYDKLMSADSSAEFYQYFDGISDEILSIFTEKHKNDVVAHIEDLIAAENVEYSGEVQIGDEALNVTVKGKIPTKDIELKIEPVSNEKITEEGFDVDSEDNIALALDIKLVNTNDGSEWQPEEGESIEVSFDMAALGYEDDTVFRLHHKHGDKIDRIEILVVTDGKITVHTSGFSIYLVTEVGEVSRATQITNNTTLEVGQEVVYYYVNNTDTGNNGSRKGTWQVTDTSGAIHYTVHSNDTAQNIGHNMVYAQWIKIVALRETTEPISITFNYARVSNPGAYNSQVNNQTSETFELNIITPKAKNQDDESNNDGRRLYISDMVNSTGTITAALVDRNGNPLEKGLDGAAFEWTRSDGFFIVPQAFENNYKSVNIARDHGGLVEARMKKDGSGYAPVTYNLKVTLADGTELTDSYTVYYQSEIINAGFEFPNAATSNYSFFPNGYPELYWKTTAPGSTAEPIGRHVTKDVEYADVTNGTSNLNNQGTNFTVTRAADYADGGVQFAELNAEAVGALYQDIITVPSTEGDPESIEWDFCHAARADAGSNTNSMYIVIGPTEQAQKLTTQTQLNNLGQAATQAANRMADGGAAFRAGTAPVEIEFGNGDNRATYSVWYHTANTNYNQNNGWYNISGEYQVPEGQYRTRLFFVSAPQSSNANYGNLIDISKAGQYKSYLIEYYEETYTADGQLQLQYFGSRSERGEAIVYSSVDLINFDHFEKEENDYLYKILINNQTYPYDIRYSDTASLYIEKYPGASTSAKVPTIHIYEKDKDTNQEIRHTDNYGDYDIVMQVFFRDTVIAVQKELVLPTQGVDENGKKIEGMTEMQKLTLLEKLVASETGGYKATFKLTTTTTNTSFIPEEKSALITKRDPAGNLKSFVALGNNPPLGATYVVEEVRPMELEGLVLKAVDIGVLRYYMGDTLEDAPVEISYDEVTYKNLDDPLVSAPIFLGDVTMDNGQTVSVKIADVSVVNTYEEKMTKIYYHAVGNGKIKRTNVEGYEDTPVEELKYYSGKSVGVSVHPGAGASYIYWYTDPECTQRVTDKDGVVEADGTFRPNANIINAEEVHFYAKFETFSIDINRTNAASNQTFLYKVERMESADSNNVIDTMYVTIVCDNNGNGSVSILELPQGTYRVTEIDEWSWRHPYVSEAASIQTGTHTSNPEVPIEFNFTQSPSTEAWLNGYSDPKKNIYQKGAG